MTPAHNIALIPARGGSKRIPRKNIKPFRGKPMIAYSIEAALNSGLFSQVIVSTDDEEIASTARQYGATTPFMRPQALADDHATTGVVIAHALNWLIEAGVSLDALCCIYATAPLLSAHRLQQGWEALQGRTFAFSATSYAFPIQRALKATPEGGVSMFWPEHRQTRSQDLPHAYHDAGQFYWGWRQSFLEGLDCFAPEASMVVLPRHEVVDIDTLEDWAMAEVMYEVVKKRDQRA